MGIPTRTPVSKATRIIALCSVANFINAADRVLMPITIIPMTRQYHWDLYWQGWVLSSFAFGYLTSQATRRVLGNFSFVPYVDDVIRFSIIHITGMIIGASAATRFGGKSVLLFAVFLWSASTFLTPLVAHSVLMLVLCRVVLGLGEGLGLPTVFHIFANQVPVEERSRAFAYLVAAGSVGQTVAAVVCPHIEWSSSFYVFGAMGLLWVFVWLIFYVDPPASSHDELPLIMPKVTNLNVRWVELLRHSSLWAIYTAHFCMNWSNYVIMQWLPTYLSNNLGAKQESLSLTALPYVANSMVGVVSGHLADSLILRRWTVLSVRRWMTAIGLLGPGLCLLAFCAVNNLLLAILFITISMGLCACNSAGHLSNHAEVAPNHAGVSFAISNTLATIPGILCGPVTANLVTSSHGRWYPVFVIAAFINLTGAVVYASQSSASQVV